MEENGNKLVIYLCMIGVVFLSSFRSPDPELALDYSVPSYIQLLQTLSVPIVLLLMLLSIGFMFRVPTEMEKEGGKSYLPYFFIFQVIILLTEFSRQNNATEFLIRLLFGIITFIYFLKVVANLPIYRAEGFSVLAAFFWGSFFFIALNVLIHVSGIGHVIWKGRLFGVTAHPNFMGICASIETILAFVFLWKERKWKRRSIFLIAFAVGIYACLLTMSRTSMLGVATGVFIFFMVGMKNSSFKPFFMILLALVSMLLVANLTMQSLDYADRGNTREQTWRELYEDASELPLIGKGRSGASTNAYMFAIVAGGVLGAAFFFRSLFGVMASAFTDLLNTHNFKRLAFLALLTLILVTSVFEGYLLDTVSIPSFTYWMLLAVTRQL